MQYWQYFFWKCITNTRIVNSSITTRSIANTPKVCLHVYKIRIWPYRTAFRAVWANELVPCHNCFFCFNFYFVFQKNKQRSRTDVQAKQTHTPLLQARHSSGSPWDVHRILLLYVVQRMLLRKAVRFACTIRTDEVVLQRRAPLGNRTVHSRETLSSISSWYDDGVVHKTSGRVRARSLVITEYLFTQRCWGRCACAPFGCLRGQFGVRIRLCLVFLFDWWQRASPHSATRAGANRGRHCLLN